MSNLVDRAAIMAPPPSTAQQAQVPMTSGIMETLKLPNLGNLVLIGGIMWTGGKAAAWLWNYFGLDEKPKATKRNSRSVAVEEPEDDEDEPDEDEPDE